MDWYVYLRGKGARHRTKGYNVPYVFGFNGILIKFIIQFKIYLKYVRNNKNNYIV